MAAMSRSTSVPSHVEARERASINLQKQPQDLAKLRLPACASLELLQNFESLLDHSAAIELVKEL